jgi:hypothetical protein
MDRLLPLHVDRLTHLLDLQAYVLCGTDLPQSETEFEQLMPENKFKQLTDIDPAIYHVCI